MKIRLQNNDEAKALSGADIDCMACIASGAEPGLWSATWAT
jgi:hypothetical protein